MPLGAGGAAAAGGVVSVAVLPIWEEAHHMVVWSCWDAASPIPAGLMHVTAAVVPNAPGEPFSHKVDLAMPELHADDSSTGIHLAAGPRGAASVFAACGGEIVALYDICRSAAPEAGEAPWAGGGAQWPHTDELWAGGGAAWQASWDHTPADRAWATQLFEMFDQDQDGALSYSEFVAGLLCLPLLCSALAWAPVLAWQPSSPGRAENHRALRCALNTVEWPVVPLMNHGRGGVRRYINRKIDPTTTARLAFQLFDLRKEGKVFRDDLGFSGWFGLLDARGEGRIAPDRLQEVEAWRDLDRHFGVLRCPLGSTALDRSA